MNAINSRVWYSWKSVVCIINVPIQNKWNAGTAKSRSPKGISVNEWISVSFLGLMKNIKFYKFNYKGSIQQPFISYKMFRGRMLWKYQKQTDRVRLCGILGQRERGRSCNAFILLLDCFFLSEQAIIKHN